MVAQTMTIVQAVFTACRVYKPAQPFSGVDSGSVEEAHGPCMHASSLCGTLARAELTWKGPSIPEDGDTHEMITFC